MPDPPPAKDQYTRDVRRAHAEGSRQRQQFRQGLIRQMTGLPLDAEYVNVDGETIDAKGRVVARDAKHIKEILGRRARQRQKGGVA